LQYPQCLGEDRAIPSRWVNDTRASSFIRASDIADDFKILKYLRCQHFTFNILNFTLSRSLENKNLSRVLILIFRRCILKIVLQIRLPSRSYLSNTLQNKTVRFEGRSLGQYLILRDWKCNDFLPHDRSHVAHKVVSQDPENRASIFTHTLVFAPTGVVRSGMPRDSEFSALAQTHFSNQVSSVIEREIISRGRFFRRTTLGCDISFSDFLNNGVY